MIRYETWAEMEKRVKIEDIRNAFGGAWVQRDHGSAARWEYVDTPKSAFYLRAKVERELYPLVTVPGHSKEVDLWPNEPRWEPDAEADKRANQSARSAESVGDDSSQGLSLRSSTRKASRNVRQRSPGLLQQARDVGHNDQEIG